MDEKAETVLKYPLKVLSWCGQNPIANKTKHITFGLINLSLGVVGVSITLTQFFYANGNVIGVVQNCEACAGFIQGMGKALVASININNFRQMIEDFKHFWSIKKCFNKAQIELEATFMQTLRLEKIYSYVMVFGTCITVMLPIFTKQLPTGAWLMKDYDELFAYTLIFQEFYIPVLAIFAIGYDCLFLSSCTLIRTQFKMLHYLLIDLKVSDVFNETTEKFYLNKLRSYIDYHDFLLRFSRNMQDTYSPVMLSQYTSCLMLIFAEMYGLFESKDIFMFPKTTFIMVAVLLQLGFYCIPLNYVSDEAILVSHGIYESDWYSRHISSLKTTIPLIIQRSQKEIVFKAGGMFEMNCGTVLSVVKISYSLCTIARGLKNI